MGLSSSHTLHSLIPFASAKHVILSVSHLLFLKEVPAGQTQPAPSLFSSALVIVQVKHFVAVFSSHVAHCSTPVEYKALQSCFTTQTLFLSSKPSLQAQPFSLFGSALGSSHSLQVLSSSHT